MASKNETPVASLLDGFEWTETRAVLEEFRSLLKCSLCGLVPPSPHNLGRCPHIFCLSCLEEHNGGVCPVPGCLVHAPAGEKRPNLEREQLTRSVFALGELLLGDPVPERFKETTREIDKKKVAPGSKEATLNEKTVSSNDDVPAGNKLTDSKVLKEKKAVRSKKIKEDKSIIAEDAAKVESKNLKRNSLPLSDNQPQKPLKQKRQKTSSVDSLKLSKQKENLDNAEVDKQASLEPKISTNVNSGSDSDFEPSKLPEKNKPKAISGNTSKKSSSESKQKISPKAKTKSLDGLNKKNKKGETPLHTAAGKGDLETVRKLLEEGASPNTWDHAGWTPLHEAAGYGNLPLVTMLLDAGASPSVPATDDNLTPLHDAVRRGYVEVVTILVARGADTTAKDSKGNTPRDLAINEKILEALDTEVEVSCSQLDRSQVVEDVKVVVVAAPGVNEAMWKKMSVAARKVGVDRVLKAVTEEATHCLVEPKESVDYYMGLLCGADLVSSEWLLQCGAAGQFVDEEPFRVCVLAGNREGLEKAREARSKRLPGLLAGGHICLVGSFDNTFPTRQHIIKLVKMAGGKIVTREPDPESIPPDEQTVFYHAVGGSSLVKTSHVIIYQAGGRKEPMIKYKMPHLKTLPVSWLFECFNTYSLVDPSLFE